MKNHKLLKALIIAVMCIFAYPLSAVAQSSNGVAVSFSLLKVLSSKSADGAIQYLRSHGCTVQNGGDIYYTQVRGGTIAILPEDMSFRRVGVSPVEFTTSDANVRDAWYRGLRKAGYSLNGSTWVKSGNYPQYRVFDYLNDTESRYYGSCILVLSSYPQANQSVQGNVSTYKGTIGKYKITMQLYNPISSGADEWYATGKYWYGTGKNGKMLLRGSLTKYSGLDFYEFDEYDPKGNKCGSFELTGDGKSLRGSMTNKAGTKYQVYLEKVE